jgi:hypothetical protein
MKIRISPISGSQGPDTMEGFWKCKGYEGAIKKGK